MKKNTNLFLLMVMFLVCTSTISAQNPQSEELSKLYNEKQFEKAVVKAREFLKDDPKNVDFNAVLGRALADMGQYQEAIEPLKFVAEKDNSWRKAWSVGYLGTAYFMLSDLEYSKAALQIATQLNITQNATRYATRYWLIFGFHPFFDNWETSETEHFRFHFQNMTISDKEMFMKTREKAFETINSFFENVLPKKIDFFVWQSRDDALNLFKSPLGFADPQFCVIHSHYSQTRGHELTHVISNYTGKPVAKTGLINEGTAVCFDLSDNNRQEMVKNWLKNNNQKIDIKDLWTNWGKYPQELSYPLSGLFVEELISRFGKEKFITFFPNQTYENALIVFGSQTDTLIQEFQNRFN